MGPHSGTASRANLGSTVRGQFRQQSAPHLSFGYTPSRGTVPTTFHSKFHWNMRKWFQARCNSQYMPLQLCYQSLHTVALWGLTSNLLVGGCIRLNLNEGDHQTVFSNQNAAFPQMGRYHWNAHAPLSLATPSASHWQTFLLQEYVDACAFSQLSFLLSASTPSQTMISWLDLPFPCWLSFLLYLPTPFLAQDTSAQKHSSPFPTMYFVRALQCSL